MMYIKKHKKIIIILFIILFLFYINCFTRFPMYHLPKGDFIESLDSPSGEYTIKSYRYSGGATVDWHLRVEVINNSTNKATNIYYKYHEYDSTMEWLDDNNVIINGEKLNIHTDYVNK